MKLPDKALGSLLSARIASAYVDRQATRTVMSIFATSRLNIKTGMDRTVGSNQSVEVAPSGHTSMKRRPKYGSLRTYPANQTARSMGHLFHKMGWRSPQKQGDNRDCYLMNPRPLSAPKTISSLLHRSRPGQLDLPPPHPRLNPCGTIWPGTEAGKKHGFRNSVSGVPIHGAPNFEPEL